VTGLTTSSIGFGLWTPGDIESSSTLCRMLFFAGMGGEEGPSVLETCGESLLPGWLLLIGTGGVMF